MLRAEQEFRMAEDSSVLEMRSVTKSFPGVQALKSVDLKIRAGEVRGLVGKNGAGKSTLMNILTGIYPADSGEILISGTTIENMTTAKARAAGIGYVHQHSQLIPPLSVAENVFCGNLPTSFPGVVDWAFLNREAERRLKAFGLNIDVNRKVEGLTVAERQMIEIAKALFANARIIILDEPTAPLPKNEVQMLFGFVRRLALQGVSFVYISHFLEEVFALCDSVTVLRDGEIVAELPVSTLSLDQLVRLISGAQVQSFHHASAQKRGSPSVLQIKNLSCGSAYADVDMTLNEGEIVGLTGLEGCGKEQLILGLAGIEPLGEGTVLVDGSPFHPVSSQEAIHNGIAYVPRDRQGLGIFGIRSVAENISLSVLRRFRSFLGLIDGHREKDHVRQYVEKLRILTPSIAQEVAYLSGGNQQKVVFARVASIGPRVMLLHEPTQGVDVQAKLEIMRIIDEMARDGVAVLVVSEEIRELLDVCDRVFVMYNGRVVREFASGAVETTVDNVLLAVEGDVGA
jgi:ABC-type sugar transport system ATPase subunit